MTTFRLGLAFVLATALLGAQSGYDLFQQGLALERAEADLPGAIVVYEQIIQASGTDRKLAAQALFRIGECQREMGNAEARKAYERILSDYSDQGDVVADAQARLADLSFSANGEAAVRRLWTMYGNWRMGPVSLDGRYHAYSVGEGLVVRDLKTDDVRRIDGIQNEDEDFVFDAVVSPDNKQIAFGGMMGGRHEELLVVGMSGTAPRTVFKTVTDNNVSWVIPTGWTPDNKEVLVEFTRQHETTWHIGMISVETGDLRVLKEFESPVLNIASLSPDGRWVAYDALRSPGSSESGIYVMRSDGTGDHIIVNQPAGNSEPYWTADSRGIVFRSDRRGSMDAWFLPVADGQADGPAVMIKADIPGDLRGVSRDGTLFYEANASTYQVRDVSLNQATGETLSPPEPVPVAYTGRILSTALSPDGEWVAYSRPDAVIVLHSLTRHEERELKHGKPGNGSIAWYPDGNALLLFGRDKDGKAGIWKVDAATGEASLLYLRSAMMEANMAYRAPTVAPDGRTFYVLGQQTGSPAILAIDSKNKAFRTLASFKGDFLGKPTVSPNGNYVAVSFTHHDSGNGHGVSIVDTQTGESRELCETPARTEIGGWTPDSRSVVIATGTEADPDQVELWRVPLDGGDIVKSPLPDRFSDGFELQPQINGNHLVWSTGRLTREVWAVDNVLPETRAAE